MDTIKIINYTNFPNLAMLFLGLLQPGAHIALPVLEDDPELVVLLPYLRRGGIAVQWYHKDELTKPIQKSLTDALLLPAQWSECFPVLCRDQQNKDTLILLKLLDLEKRIDTIPEVKEAIQLHISNATLKNNIYFCVSHNSNLLSKLQRLSCYDIVMIPSFPKND